MPRMEVVVPEGLGGGNMSIKVGEQTFTLTVPADMRAGQILEVELPVGAARGKPSGQFTRYVFLDLENLAFLAEGLQPLAFACRHHGIEFRAYCSPTHNQADRATRFSRSAEREAAGEA